MPTTATAAIPHAAAKSTLLSDYATLFKPRVSTMVVITAAAGYYLGCLRSSISPFAREHAEALLGIAIVTAGSSVLNQALERRTDRLMPRTASRPMAQYRISLTHGLLLGFLAVIGGSLYLTHVSTCLPAASRFSPPSAMSASTPRSSASPRSTPSSEPSPARSLRSSAGQPRAE